MNREELKKHLIGFHKWMLKHDGADYAEQYFHYSDEDMAEEYLKEVSPQDIPAMIEKINTIDKNNPELKEYRDKIERGNKQYFNSTVPLK